MGKTRLWQKRVEVSHWNWKETSKKSSLEDCECRRAHRQTRRDRPWW